MKNYERNNPFTLTFGKKPEEYIVRRESLELIKSAFMSEPAKCQTYLINGVRGSGKTVLMTAISKEIVEEPDWICVDLNSSQNLLEDLSYRLEDEVESIESVFDRGIDISAAGFGIGIGGRESRDSVSRCEKIFEMLIKKKKKVLITIDEVINDQSMRQFASQFQIWIRKDYSIFLLMTGLYENISSIQNSPQLTFLLRAPKLNLGPLSIAQISRQYESVFNISREKALQLAKETKGYAFAFQALGMLYWNQKDNPNETMLINQYEEYLDEYVYMKTWDGLSETDKKVVLQMSDDNPTKVKEICETIGMTSASFSKYRERLIKRGIISGSHHGYVEFLLPRFRSVCEYYV